MYNQLLRELTQVPSLSSPPRTSSPAAQPHHPIRTPLGKESWSLAAQFRVAPTPLVYINLTPLRSATGFTQMSLGP